MSGKYKKTCNYLNYVKCMFVWASTVTGCISKSAITSLVAVPVSVASSTVGLKICGITASIKKYKSIIKKKKKKYDKIVMLGKTLEFTIAYFNRNAIEVATSKTLINIYISRDEFVSVNNVLREYNEMKEEIKNPETSVEFII